MKPANAVTTTHDAIEALGGTMAVSRLTGKSPQSVTNYRRAARFPADTFLIMRAALQEKGFDAAPSLWGIQAPLRASA